MDTRAYLTGQGWLGTGHSLHPTGRGIKKPLLVSRKSNVLGVGKKKHDTHADQWWARAFDAGLKSLEVGRSESSGATESVKAGTWGQLDTLKAGGQKWAGNGGLYAGFVRGEGLSGTITPELLDNKQKDSESSGRIGSRGQVHVREKRISGVEGQKDQEERRQEKMAKRSKKAAAAMAEGTINGRSMSMSTETALMVINGDHVIEEAELRQREDGALVENRRTLLDEGTADVETVWNAGRRKKKRRKGFSPQDPVNPEQSKASTGKLTNSEESPIGSSLESAAKKRRRKKDRTAD